MKTTKSGFTVLFLIVGLLLARPMFGQQGLDYSINPDGKSITIDGTDREFSPYWNLPSYVIPSPIDGLPVTAVSITSGPNNFSWASVTVPDSVTTILQGGFFALDYLTSIDLGNSVTNIEYNAFASCLSLPSITLPATLVTIGDQAFYNCDSLTAVYFEGTPPTLGGTNVFGIYLDRICSATANYLPGKAGWSNTFAGLPTALWQPKMQTSDTSFGVQTNQFGFNINWASGMTVVVESTTSLIKPVWTPISTNTLASDTVYFADPQWTNSPSRFYRLRWP